MSLKDGWVRCNLCKKMCQSDCDCKEVAFRLSHFDEVKDAFMDMLNQACGDWELQGANRRVFKGYDSMCLSSYERALDLAAELGWIKREDILR